MNHAPFDVAEKIRLVSFVHYDLGFFDEECGNRPREFGSGGVLQQNLHPINERLRLL